MILQGDPNQNLKFVLAITLKRCVSDPMLVKPKCVLEVSVYFLFSAVCSQFSAVCLQFSKLNWHLPNTFWLYQYRVRYAYLLSYSQNKFQILIWVTLYVGHEKSEKPQKIAVGERNRTRASWVTIHYICLPSYHGGVKLEFHQKYENLNSRKSAVRFFMSNVESR